MWLALCPQCGLCARSIGEAGLMLSRCEDLSARKRTTYRFPAWSWWRQNPEIAKPCLKGGAAYGRIAANRYCRARRQCRSMRAPGRKRLMSNNQSRREFCSTALATIFASATSVKAAEKKYDPGASDTEIKGRPDRAAQWPGARFTACSAGSAKPISRCSTKRAASTDAR